MGELCVLFFDVVRFFVSFSVLCFVGVMFIKFVFALQRGKRACVRVFVSYVWGCWFDFCVYVCVCVLFVIAFVSSISNNSQ